MTTRQRLSAERSQQLTRLLTITKTANMRALMEASELAKVIALVAVDIGKSDEMARAFPVLWPKISPQQEYYATAVDWFTNPDETVTSFDVVDMLDAGTSLDQDFMTYLKCLTELHKRRRKYGLILQRQPLPTMVQVSPRALMEYGPDFPPEALASWLTWRKFFYDLDNRSAQETGYLFEPILAAAIGGEAKSARERVVRRTDDPTKGRQVDCWKVLPDGTPLAYELKLRVTIAASGQGRFGEELSFARDCSSSGAKPILVVLDPTENDKLTGLQAAYREVGGALMWAMRLGLTSKTRRGQRWHRLLNAMFACRLASVSSFERVIEGDATKRSLILQDLQARFDGNELTISLGGHQRLVERHEDQSLAADGDDDSE
uniref:ApaLI restriction endonuclease n=1 Tax=Acetobacter pasteurianus TaxID=438 RepID=P70751_ACEPA|nr:ApaLI restriction endonuclease [Acetobacter pasteurianus]